MADDQRRPNTLLRLLVPLAVVLGGIGIAYLYAMSGSRPPTPPSAASPSTTPADPAAPTPPAGTTAEAPATETAAPPPIESPPDATPTAGAPAPVARNLEARRFPAEPVPPLGDLKPKGEGGLYEMQLEFAEYGAGLSRLAMANHREQAGRKGHETIQTFYPLDPGARVGATPFAAASVAIDGQTVDLSLVTADPDVTLWRPTGPGAFEAVIVETDAEGAEREVARITRRYVLAPGSYEFALVQNFQNLSDREQAIVWMQYGPVDVPLGVIRYGGDPRRLRFGYQRAADPERHVHAKDYVLSHDESLGKPATDRMTAAGRPVWEIKPLWPDAKAASDSRTLTWAAMTGQYFGVAMHPPTPPAPPTPAGAPGSAAPAAGIDKPLRVVERVDRLAVAVPNPRGADEWSGAMILRTTSPRMTVAPGASADLSLHVYAGPLSKRFINAEPAGGWYNLEKLIVFSFGGPCAFCTFQPVAWTLREFLGFLHDYILRDWALAIMVLVVCVRTLLHPVTRWSQLSMLRFSKQMQALAPKQRALQEKYKNDPAKLREEVGRLMREEHVDYGAAARGCLPMFLQMPIWIALFAMIFFTFELRHEAAFYGVIQKLTGGRWSFLADLSQPDNFVNFQDAFGWGGFRIWGLSSFMGPIEGLNILPLVMGVVFYIQQKYLSPPSTTPLTPEQEQQQKMMKVMMVVMFPVFMFNAPAGLALYFLMNSTLGILESKWIRSHADQLEKRREAHAAATGHIDRKAPPRKPGFFARMQAEIARRQSLIEEQKRKAAKRDRKR